MITEFATQAPGPFAVSSTNPRYFTAAAAPKRRSISPVRTSTTTSMTGWVWAAIVRKTRSGSTLTRTCGYSLSAVTTSFAYGGGSSSGASLPGQCALLHDATALATYRTRDRPRTGSPGLICRPSIRAISIGFGNACRRGRAGIYVSMMLFEGFSLHLTAVPDNIEVIRSMPRTTSTASQSPRSSTIRSSPSIQRVEAFHLAYIRKVIDTVHDLPKSCTRCERVVRAGADSVVFPDGSSIETPIGDSPQWQYWVINNVKAYERDMGYDPHPIGMTYLYPLPIRARRTSHCGAALQIGSHLVSTTLG